MIETQSLNLDSKQKNSARVFILASIFSFCIILIAKRNFSFYRVYDFLSLTCYLSAFLMCINFFYGKYANIGLVLVSLCVADTINFILFIADGIFFMFVFLIPMFAAIGFFIFGRQYAKNGNKLALKKFFTVLFFISFTAVKATVMMNDLTVYPLEMSILCLIFDPGILLALAVYFIVNFKGGTSPIVDELNENQKKRAVISKMDFALLCVFAIFLIYPFFIAISNLKIVVTDANNNNFFSLKFNNAVLLSSLLYLTFSAALLLLLNSKRRNMLWMSSLFLLAASSEAFYADQMLRFQLFFVGVLSVFLTMASLIDFLFSRKLNFVGGLAVAQIVASFVSSSLIFGVKSNKSFWFFYSLIYILYSFAYLKKVRECAAIGKTQSVNVRIKIEKASPPSLTDSADLLAVLFAFLNLFKLLNLSVRVDSRHFHCRETALCSII